MLAFTCAGMLAFVALAEPPVARPGTDADAAVDAHRLAARGCRCSATWPRWCSRSTAASWAGARDPGTAGGADLAPTRVAAVRVRRSSRRWRARARSRSLYSPPPAGPGQLFWVPLHGMDAQQQVLESLTGSGLQSTFHPTFLAQPGLWITVAAVLLVLGLCVRARRRPRRTPDGRAGASPSRWPAGARCSCSPGRSSGPALVFVYSFVSQPIFLPRNLLASVPAVALVVALVICDRGFRARSPRPRWCWRSGSVVPLALSYDVSPEPWDAATHAVLTAARPGDCVVFYPEDGHNPFQYYSGRRSRAERSRRDRCCRAPAGRGAIVRRALRDADARA